MEQNKLPAWAVPSRVYSRGCQRWVRLSVLSAAIVALVVLVGFHNSHPRRKPFEYFPADREPMIHDKPVSEWQAKFPMNSVVMEPFPESPKEGPPVYEKYDGRYLPWLAAVIVSPGETERRQLIRESWMHLYRDVPFDGRFIIGNPTGELRQSIMTENRTHGDIIVLEDLQANEFFANSIKTLELYKWLVRNKRQYAFVSKIDSDAFLNARGFWDRYLEPRLADKLDDNSSTSTSEAQNTVIGSVCYSRHSDVAFPHGSFYTSSWDMVEQFAKLQDEHQVVTGEDLAIPVLLHKGKKTARIVNIGSNESFNFDEADTRGDGSAWARPETHPNSQMHAVYSADTILVHQLKDEDQFLRVGDCFDSSGVKDMPAYMESDRQTALPFSSRWYDFWYNMGFWRIYQSRLDRLPESWWQFKDGNWWLHDVWNFGPER